MPSVSFAQFPNGQLVDLSNTQSSITNNPDGTAMLVFYNAAGVQVFSYPYSDHSSAAAAAFAVGTAFSAFMVSQATATQVEYSTDDSTWTALPAPASTPGIYFQITGTGLSAATQFTIGGNTQYPPSTSPILTNSGTVITGQVTGVTEFLGGINYILVLFDANNNLVVAFPGVTFA